MAADTIEKARSFFKANGRDIDKARFEFHFGDLPQEELLSVLARYQNPDGGFGNGLEPDISAPESNPFAIDLALQICIHADVTPEHELLQRTVAYLEREQSEEGEWRFTPEVYTRPMAPWFQGWVWPNLNPACPIAGHLQELGLGSERLHDRVAALFERLANPLDLVSDEFYNIGKYAYYFTPQGDSTQREFFLSGVLWWLIRQHAGGKLADNGHFFEYVRDPSTYTGMRIPSPILNSRLDALAAEQADDGGWPTPYDPHWRGWATVQNLLVLEAFDWI
jgi:hypothetical protein